MKIINVTHTDLDGIGCTIVLKSWFKYADVESHFCNYHEVEQELTEILDGLSDNVANIYITDISFRDESGLVEKIDALNKKKGFKFVRVYDHHATSSYLNKYDWAWSHERDSSSGELKCGTKWLYDKLLEERKSNSTSVKVNPTLENFVRLVNLWDTWRWVTDYPEDQPCEEASWLNMVLNIEGKRKFITNYVRKILTQAVIFGPVEQELIDCNLQEIESDIHKKDSEMIVRHLNYYTRKDQLRFIENYIKSNNLKNMGHLLEIGYHKTLKIGVIYLDRNVSTVCNALAKMHPELDLIMSISLPKTVSLRCIKDLDVPLGILANFITGKGGGHPKSAGGSLRPDLATKIAGQVINSILF